MEPTRPQIESTESIWEDTGIGIGHLQPPPRRQPTRPDTRPSPAPVVSEPRRRGPRPRRLNVLEQRSAALPPVTEVKGVARRSNPYLPTDNTSLETKMMIGLDIEKKPPRRSPPISVEDRPWNSLVMYPNLFLTPNEGGYSVADIRALANKTGRVNVDRTIWDRQRLLRVVVDYLLDTDQYDLVKKSRPPLINNPLEVYRANLDISGILSDHYQEDPVYEQFKSLMSAEEREDQDFIETVRDSIQDIMTDDLYNSRLDTYWRGVRIMEEVPDIRGDVLYLDTIGNDNAIDAIRSTSIRSVSTSPDRLYDFVILDHALDLKEFDEGFDLSSLLKPGGRVLVISYDQGYNAIDRRFRDVQRAFEVYRIKSLIDMYLTPNSPYISLDEFMDETGWFMDYLDEPQIRQRMRPLRELDTFIMSDPGDPIVEIARLYGN